MTEGFTVISRAGEIELHFRSKPGPLLTFARTADHAVVLLGRLYYRDELRAELEEVGESDADLALAAYRNLGLDGLARLEGDFALVLWDARANRLVGCRDPLGGYPLFHTTTPQAFAFSTGLRPLLDLLPSCSLDRDYLADFLMLPRTGIQEVPGERCAFEGICRVEAGSLIQHDVASRQVVRRACWNWLERRIDPGTDRLDELAEQFGALLRQAVRERLRGRVASHLSGGMDSTTVSLLAREALAEGTAPGPLHTLSLVYDRLPHLARETRYLETILSRLPDVVPHLLPGDELLDYDDFTGPLPHDEPFAGLWRGGMGRALVAASVRAGAATMLTGVGADEMLDVQPFHLADLLRSGRWWSAWAEAGRWARANNCSRWQLLSPFGLAPLLPAWGHMGLRTWFRGGHASWEKQSEWTIAPWVRRDFARRHDLRGRALDRLRRAYPAGRPVGLSVALAAVADNTGDCERWYRAAPHGLAIAHPFLDARVLRFGLGLQARHVAEPGRAKPVLAEATRGLLPEAIRNRPRKGNFNEVYFRGLARNLPQLERLVAEGPVEELGLFDKDVLVQCLHRAALGVASGVNALDRLNLSLCLLQWLTQQSTWPPTAGPPWEVVPISVRSPVCVGGLSLA
jgi:asparagine synthase (glutamine-hydrolysing)